MNDRALTGVLMIGAAGAIAWAWLNGHLDAAIAKATQRATGTAKTSTTTRTGTVPAAGFRSGRES
jgi:hypothetical protein